MPGLANPMAASWRGPPPERADEMLRVTSAEPLCGRFVSQGRPGTDY